MESSIPASWYLFSFFLHACNLRAWFLNYPLLFEHVKITNHFFNWNTFSTAIQRKIDFNYLLLFQLFFLVSKLYEFVQLILQFGSDVSKLRQYYHFRAFSIVIYGNFNSNFSILFYLFSSDLQIVHIWSINFTLEFAYVKIYKRCVCWNLFSSAIYRLVTINCLLLLAYFPGQ